MTTQFREPSAAIIPVGDFEPLAAVSGDLSLNSSQVPYAQAFAQVELTDLADIELLDPRNDIRVLIQQADAITGQLRTCNLGLRGRVVDHDLRKIELTLASDEALLMDYAPLADDRTPYSYRTSLRAVCNYVLGKIGASLAASTVDADVTPRWSLTNMISNPSFEVDASGWVAGAGTSSVARSTAIAAAVGTGYLNVTAGTVGISQARISSGISVRAGERYVFGMRLRPNVTGLQSGIFVWMQDSSGNLIKQSSSPLAPLPNNVWTPVFLPVLIPAGVEKVVVGTIMISTASGQVMRADAAMFYEGTDTVDYFDGSNAPAGYTTAWNEAAGLSTSYRTPIGDDTDPESLTWPVGINGWDFIEPLANRFGMALFCDEQRVWRLIRASEYSVPGLVSISALNTASGTDTISRDDPNFFATGVVVRYTWRAANGIERVRDDKAGTPGRVVLIEMPNRAWPGAGVAAAILARRSGQGRVQEVRALSDLTVTPGQQVNITLPGTDPQTGQVEGVEWGLTDGHMTITTRALTDIIPGSIDALVGTIDSLVGTIDSL